MNATDFSITRWTMRHSGTNGYVSSWGPMLSGVTPVAAP